jgi:NTE family protein
LSAIAAQTAEAPLPQPPATAGFFTGLRQRKSPMQRAPGIAAAMMDAFNITQDRIARSRLAGDPPDVMISARLGAIGLFDFHRADELIAMGREAARRALPDIAAHLELMPLGDNVAAI